MRLIMVIAAFLANSVGAFELLVPRELSCWSTKSVEVLTNVRVSIIEGKRVRSYRNVKMEDAAVGARTLTFTKRTVPTAVSGIKMECTFTVPGGVDTHEAGFFPDAAITVPANDAAKVKLDIEGAPALGTRKVILRNGT